MRCPVCGKNMTKTRSHVFCSHCGYLDDGKQIHGYKDRKASDIEIYLGDEFNKIWRNENWPVSFLLGPLYLCTRGFVITGLLLIPVELWFWDFVGYSFDNFSILLRPLAFVISRMFFAGINNMICIYYYQKRIDRIKKKHPNNYLEILRNKRRTIPTGLAICAILLTLIIGLLIFLYFLINVWDYYFFPF